MEQLKGPAKVFSPYRGCIVSQFLTKYHKTSRNIITKSSHYNLPGGAILSRRTRTHYLARTHGLDRHEHGDTRGAAVLSRAAQSPAARNSHVRARLCDDVDDFEKYDEAAVDEIYCMRPAVMRTPGAPAGPVKPGVPVTWGRRPRQLRVRPAVPRGAPEYSSDLSARWLWVLRLARSM